MNKGQVDICLCAYNAGRFIAQAIKSVLDQTYKDFILYVVNDASTDDTFVVAKSFLYDKRVRIVDLKENIGTYAGKNFVLKNFAGGEYWAHHDSDDYSDAQRIKKQIIYLGREKLDGCGTAIDEFYEDGVEPRIPADSELVLDHSNRQRHRVNIYPQMVSSWSVSEDIVDLPKLKIAMNGSLLFNLSAVKSLGGFDGHTKIGGDSDFLWRFVKFFKFGNTSDVLYHRRFHKESLTQDKITGHDSDIRRVYAQAALDKHKKNIELQKNGKMEEALRNSTYNFYYPNISFKIYGEK